MYVGCYEDSPVRAMSCAVDNSYTVSECAVACAEYKYFSVEYGGECFCENCLEDAVQYGSSENCNNDGLGGLWSFDLYENTDCV